MIIKPHSTLLLKLPIVNLPKPLNLKKKVAQKFLLDDSNAAVDQVGNTRTTFIGSDGHGHTVVVPVTKTSSQYKNNLG